MMLALATGSVPTALTGQGTQPAMTGLNSRVRFEAACVATGPAPGARPSPNRRDYRAERCTRYEGAVTRLSADSVMIRTDRGMVVFARSDVRAVQVRSGTRGNAGVGAGIGVAAGFAVGVGAALGTDCSEAFPRELCEASQVGQPLVGAALGGAVGALLGGFVRSDRWVPASFGAAATARATTGEDTPGRSR
jgi:hypothetical protein